MPEVSEKKFEAFLGYIAMVSKILNNEIFIFRHVKIIKLSESKTSNYLKMQKEAQRPSKAIRNLNI